MQIKCTCGLSPRYLHVRNMVNDWYCFFCHVWHSNIWYWEGEDGVMTQKGAEAFKNLKQLANTPEFFAGRKLYILRLFDILLKDFENVDTIQARYMKAELEGLRDIVKENDFNWD